jgi:glycine/D-amino acid oxidase-like deaminating enzyme
MSRRKGRVVILGGGMAGLATAWRLSEPGWQRRFESITVFHRGLGQQRIGHHGQDFGRFAVAGDDGRCLAVRSTMIS